MFHLITIEDKIRVPPSQFNNEIQTIEDEIEKKYTNKIVLGGGLFIALYEILGTGDAYVYSGDGGAHVLVKFSMVVFKPFKGEVIEGYIKSCTSEQLQLTLGFYDEIFVLSIDLPTPSYFDEKEKLWFWVYGENSLYFEKGGKVRFKVDTVEFNPEVSQPPPRPKNVNTDLMDSRTLQEHKQREDYIKDLAKQTKSPMILKVSMRDPGLGMISWWTSQDAEDEEEEEDYSGMTVDSGSNLTDTVNQQEREEEQQEQQQKKQKPQLQPQKSIIADEDIELIDEPVMTKKKTTKSNRKIISDDE
ncbi:RNA polymerase III subunit [Tieghemostelium lacteum]|uniref:RNA polymerase III subunit n=1 Tax=Tieghemostelium lacteum TaxID=361077 RepID=A0A151ZBR7_TIELA|nr:RNA polymerase III subunit [Tieghemostelium lacteum]|eukprot:KYQ91392.1 RNA polymerase III subunit [Tieghemostelium lacteum]